MNGDEGIYHYMARRMVETGDRFLLEFTGEHRVYDTLTHAPLFLWAKALSILAIGSYAHVGYRRGMTFIATSASASSIQLQV